MSSEYLRTWFIGLPLQLSSNRRNHGKKPVFRVRGEYGDMPPNSKFGQKLKKQGGMVSVFSGRRYMTFPVGNLSSKNGRAKMNCINKAFSSSRDFVRRLSPLWKDGLLFIRCSIFFAVLSAAAMIVWYGQVKARSFVQSQLMPSVCKIFSEYLQRELDFGRVQSISPLGVTLQSCSIGPHRGEFSCGELPVVKLKVRPFASLRRGKFVIDAVLSQPSMLIAQKEDFSWLGLPLPSEDDLKRHSSCEEGIDYRTKTRRLAREDAIAKWYKDRSDAARKAAEVGYAIPQEHSDIPAADDFSDDTSRTMESADSASFFCMDNGLHRRDHHSVDLGMEYALKHSDLEKSFGIDIEKKGFKFWPSIMLRHPKRKKKREAGRKMIAEADMSHKQKNLQRSAAAVFAYFCNSNDGSICKLSSHPSYSFPFLGSGNEDANFPIKNENAEKTVNDSSLIFEHKKSNHLVELVANEDEKENPKIFPEKGATRNDASQEVLLKHSDIDTTKDGGSLNHEGHKKYASSGLQSGEFFGIKDIFIKLNIPIKSRQLINIMRKSAHSQSRELQQYHEAGEANLVHNVDNHNRGDRSISCSSGAEDSSPEAPSANSKKILGKFQEASSNMLKSNTKFNNSLLMWSLNLKWGLQLHNHVTILGDYFTGQIWKLKLFLSTKGEDLASKLIKGVNLMHSKGTPKSLPVILDSVYFSEGTLLLQGYGDQEPREMDNINGHVKFLNHYTRVHVQLAGNCRKWRSDEIYYSDGGQLYTNVFVDIVDQKWHANLKIENLFAPLFERILELPVAWTKGRASGEVHICMSEGEAFPNLHGQLDVDDLNFEILGAPSCFSEVTANLCFRGQRVFLHNASGRFGDVPLEASGDFGINPEDGEFHLMCQVPCVEVNSLMKTLKMKPLIYSLAGSVTAVFNCQGPLDAPIFVGSGIISRKTPHLVSDFPPSPASEAISKNKECGAVAAFDHIPFSHVSANVTFNTDNCVADFYGMRASLLDGGEIRGAGNAWICPEGEIDDSAMDINLSGNLLFDKIIYRYMPTIQQFPLKIGELNGETKLSGSLLKPRFDIKWAAPKAEESFVDARGDIIICHEYIIMNASSVAFDFHTKIQTSYPENWHSSSFLGCGKSVPLTIEGVDLDLRMRGFEFSNLFFSDPFDLPRPVHLKATGKIKFLGKVVKPSSTGEALIDKNVVENEKGTSLVGEVTLSGIKLNQLMLAPELGGSLSISNLKMKLDATGRPDECMSVEVVAPLWPSSEETLKNRNFFSVSLQKGQLRTNIQYQPHHLANIEVRNLPLDELELASLRGTIQRAELQLNFQKRRGHGLLSVLHPKFSGVLGEALDIAARWSGDVITIEKTVLDQSFSHYEIQGEYVLPGTRDRYSSYSERDGFLKKALDGHLGSVISAMGRWRMRLEVPHAEVAEMLPLARLLSRSIDPAVHSRSKDIFMRSVQAMGFYAENLRGLLEAVERNITRSDDIVTEEIALPGLAEFRGHWRGSLDASGGGDGDTMAEFDFRGEDWEWGIYKSQRVLAVGAYSNNIGLRLDNMFIQKDNATLHADGTVLGPITNLHFAVLNFPVGLVPAVAQVIGSSTLDLMGPFWKLLVPMKGILHMEGDLRGNLSKPECDVQVRLLDGAVGGIDLGRAEVVASMTSNSRFLFNVNFEPVAQSGHVHVQGSVPITYIQTDTLEEEGKEKDLDQLQTSGWVNNKVRGSIEENEKKISRDRLEDGWDAQLAESLKGLNWNLLEDKEVRINADIKDGGMALLTALSPHANWIHGYADINLQVRGTIEQPLVDGSASFHRASISSPVLQKPITNLGGTIYVKSNKLCIISVESRVSRKGKLVVKGNLPLKTSESSIRDKIALKCEVLEVQAKNIFSGQVDSQMQITGSMLQPNISGKIKFSHGEAYLPHDRRNGDVMNRLTSNKSSFPTGTSSKSIPSRHVSRFFRSGSASTSNRLPQHSAKQADVEKPMDQNNFGVDVRLTDLRVFLGPELRILYPLILNFAVSGELELNGIANPKLIRPKGVLTFENGDINLVATQVRLKRDHLNIAKFEPDLGLDPTLDLALVGSEWQFRIQSPASKWQDSLLVTSTRSVDQDVLTPTEAAKVFENQLAESLLESDGQLAFKKLATATLETLMPKIEGKGEFGQARWRLVYAPQIPSLLSVDPTVDPLKSLANNLSFGTEVEVQLGKRLQASVVRQMKDSEMATQWTLVYQLTNRLRVLFQSSPSTRLLFEYSATSQS